MSEHPTQETLSAYVDGELTRAEHDMLSAHLDECSRCREAVQSARALKYSLARLEAKAEPPPGVRARVEALARRHRNRRRRRWRWAAFAALAFAAVASVAIAVWPRSSSSLANALVADHLRSVPSKKPPEVASGDPDAVRRFFAGRLPFEPRTPKLPGSELVGGRLCTIRGHTMELLFYERGTHTLSLFVSRTADATQGCERTLGHHVCKRREGELSLMLVGELPPDEMNRLLRRAGP